MTVTSQYLRFERQAPIGPVRKTPIVNVLSRTSGELLGMIKWYGAWRQFCFYPEPTTIFNLGCMADIGAQIGELMEERRA